MALSDYDTLSFDKTAKAGTGIAKNYQGASIEIYKNWLYIHDPKGWHEGMSYSKPVIAEISEGNVCIAGFEIYAARCGQGGIMVVAEYHSPKYKKHYYFGGIGCHGYKDELPERIAELGLDPSLDWGESHLYHYDEELEKSVSDILISRWINKNTDDIEREEHLYKRYVEPDEMPWPEWVGVTQDTLNEFFAWAETVDLSWSKLYKDWLNKCKETEPLRYNQGNMFFAQRINPDILQPTLVGEANDPVMENLITNMFPKQTDGANNE